MRAVELVQDAQSVQAREEQIEEDEVVVVAARALQAFDAVPCRVDGEAFGFEPPGEEASNPWFVLDDEKSHPPLSLRARP